jgi:hypothetical protein
MGDRAGDDLGWREATLLITSFGDEHRKLRAELAQARERIATLEASLDARSRPVQLPVLCRDLARWSSPPKLAPPAGRPPLPPTLDDIEGLDLLISILRRLLRTPIPAGEPYHVAFDGDRYQTLQAKHRAASLLAEKLFGQVDRSRIQKDLSWHLMLARRLDEVNRRRR